MKDTKRLSGAYGPELTILPARGIATAEDSRLSQNDGKRLDDIQKSLDAIISLLQKLVTVRAQEA